MSRRVELFYPAVGAVAIAAAWWHYAGAKFPTDEKEFLAAAISWGAILTGFIATAKAILAALPSESVMGRIRRSGYIDDLVQYLAHALYGCLLFSIVSLIGFFLLEKQPLSRWFALCWVLLGTFSVLAFVRVTRVLFRIIRFDPDGS